MTCSSGLNLIGGHHTDFRKHKKLFKTINRGLRVEKVNLISTIQNKLNLRKIESEKILSQNLFYLTPLQTTSPFVLQEPKQLPLEDSMFLFIRNRNLNF